MMKTWFLCAILLYSGGLVKADTERTGCEEVSDAALAELEELKALVDQLTVLVETIIGGPIPVPTTPAPFVLINPMLTVTWKEAKVTWTPPEGVIGYTAKLVTPDGPQPIVRLSPFEESFTTTDITVGQNYTIEIIPVKGDGPGETFVSEAFVPVCPMICTADYRPQCGTDGNTYGNPCALEVAQCEGSDETLELAYEGECDPCANIRCSPPLCQVGFVLASTPAPGECCVSCVDECAGVICLDLDCEENYVETEVDGECCPQCVYQDPCANIQCSPPVCDDGYVLESTPAPGQCCVGCVLEVFRDCSDAFASGKLTSGKYNLQPAGVSAPFQAVCDMETDGGGWTTILVRDSTGGDFYRDMADYVAGFGDLDGSHWLGLENIYRLNKDRNVQMLVQFTDQMDNSADAQYRNVRIGNADTNYELSTLVGFKGTGGNALHYNKGAPFSSRDMDNDGSADHHCAEEMVGGWWYRGDMCSRANPLGEYRTRTEFVNGKGIFWAPFKGKTHSMKFLSMKIKRPQA